MIGIRIYFFINRILGAKKLSQLNIYSSIYQAENMTTKKLKSMQEEVLQIFGEKVAFLDTYNATSLHGLHALIGSKNNTFVDSVRMKFSDPKDFIGRWTKGLIEKNGTQNYTNKYGRTHKYILIELLKDDIFREYTYTFLERNFYRNLKERTRFKPNEILWKFWFGDNKLPWALFISPVFRGSEWTNDVSEIRRANYKYWTIGHVMDTGIIDPSSSEIYKFEDLNSLYNFYRSILKRVSNSIYEKEIYDRYINYLEKSENVLEEPFLIPELRYAGIEKTHKYRLDFTILNSHTQEFVGFELSPHSTHMAISGIRTKTQIQLNEDISKLWGKEMSKRNEYFDSFGISTITFTDEDLKDMDKCFFEIEKYLSTRESESIDLDEQVTILKSL